MIKIARKHIRALTAVCEKLASSEDTAFVAELNSSGSQDSLLEWLGQNGTTYEVVRIHNTIQIDSSEGPLSRGTHSATFIIYFLPNKADAIAFYLTWSEHLHPWASKDGDAG